MRSSIFEVAAFAYRMNQTKMAAIEKEGTFELSVRSVTQRSDMTLDENVGDYRLNETKTNKETKKHKQQCAGRPQYFFVLLFKGWIAIPSG